MTRAARRRAVTDKLAAPPSRRVVALDVLPAVLLILGALLLVALA